MGRTRAWGAVVLAGGAWSVFLACSSSSGSGATSLTCGEGTTQQGNACVAVALEGGAGEGGSPGDDAGSGDSGRAGAPPVFGGVTAVAPVSETRLLVVWDQGADAEDVDDPLIYRVFAGPSSQPLSYDKATVRTQPAARSAYLDGLTPGASYVVGVRATDEHGVGESNTITKVGAPRADTTAPTFAGVKTASGSVGGGVVLTWDAAADDLSPAAAISYQVYVSDAPGGEDLTHPAVVSGPGDTTVTVGQLPLATKARYFVVRARDAAGNVDANTKELSAMPGADVTPPQFGGCTSATTVSALSIALAWTPATDDTSAPANVSYDIFASTTSGKYDFTQPFATVKGVDGAVVPSLQPGTRYYFVCRAKDEAGNEEANTLEVSSKTGNNATPPTFGGITSFTPDPVARTAAIGWSPGSDVATTVDQLVYDVFVATASGAEAYNRPPFATSAAGATSITVTGLPPNETLYFVVRCRDADGNRDVTPNPVEKSMTTNVSFAINVQPILTHDCGVVGCHVPGSPTGGLILAPGFAYAQIVGVNALELNGLTVDGGTFTYVSPGDPSTSYLNIKINQAALAAFKAQYPSYAPRTGTQMPAPSTGSTLTQVELDTIANWITQGAANN